MLTTYDSSGPYNDARILNCTFENISGSSSSAYPIYLYTFSARGPITNTRIEGNYFEQTYRAYVKFTAVSGTIRNTQIVGNRCIDIVGGATGSGANDALLVRGGLDANYNLRQRGAGAAGNEP